MLRPLLLAPDNFTAPTRTPWGGQRITQHFKANLGLGEALRNASVGESWELSLGPELPSRCESGAFLHEMIAADQHGYLGLESARGGSALLLKWLDAADELSVQLHPAVGDPRLAADETGKPESWYIVACEPRAGIYLGLRSGVTEQHMRDALHDGADVSALMNFVAVRVGDFFVLEPGMPHAVGRGVTLLEPQYVEPGKKGITLRYWDWSRRYNAAGRVDPQGQARELHVARALEVTDWQRAADPAWLAQSRGAFGAPDLAAAAHIDALCGAADDNPIASKYLRVARLSGTGSVQIPAWNTLRALTVISGSITLRGSFGEVHAETGRTLALPAGLVDLTCQLHSAHALLSSTQA